MCIICVEIAKNKLTAEEARRAIGELALSDTADAEHLEWLRESLEEPPVLPYGKNQDILDKTLSIWRGM
jgi:hypothetical protein